MLLKPTAVLTTLIASSLAYSGPPITAAAKLAARQNDPSFVGYIPMNGGCKCSVGSLQTGSRRD